MDRLAIIGAGRMAAIFANRAREIGVETYCFAWEEGAFAKESVDHFYGISIFEKEKILEICRKMKINGILATTELTISITAYIAEKLNLLGNSTNVAEVITNKYRNRNATKNVVGLGMLKYFTCQSFQELESHNFAYPIILKPTSKGGKKGIIVVNNKADLKDAFDYAQKETEDSQNMVLIEEYITGGIEYSVESLSYKGKHRIFQITEKNTSGPPHCVELGHHQPACLTNDMKCKVEKIVKEILISTGITNGPCHTEIKIVKDKIYLIELNARPGGDHITYPLTELSIGKPYVSFIILGALGKLEEIERIKLENNHAGVYFVTQQTKELKNIFDNAENYEWLYKKHLVSNNLEEVTHNDSYNINYFIYFDKEKNPVEELINLN